MFPTLIGSDNRWWKRDIVWLTSYKVSGIERILYWKCKGNLTLGWLGATRPGFRRHCCLYVSFTVFSSSIWYIWFSSPRDPKKVHIKRVAAIEGDLIRYINTFYRKIMYRPKHRAELMIVSKGTYWMEGDNPINSNDSNNYGPVCFVTLFLQSAY